MPAPQFWKFPSSRFPPSHNKPAPVVHDSSDICLCNECSRRQYNPIQVTSVTKATPIAIETSVVFKCEVCKFETKDQEAYNKHSKEKHEFVCEYQNWVGKAHKGSPHSTLHHLWVRVQNYFRIERTHENISWSWMHHLQQIFRYTVANPKTNTHVTCVKSHLNLLKNWANKVSSMWSIFKG